MILNLACRSDSTSFFMMKSIFDPARQIADVPSKVVVGLERISEAFKVLLWREAKELGLSPIQIQILIFLAYHAKSLQTVSYLAKEFNVSKPTISDAVRILHQKKLVLKSASEIDSRSYTLKLTSPGKKIVEKVAHFTTPLHEVISSFKKEELNNLFEVLSKLIFKLHQKDIISVQRTCFGCRFYQESSSRHYCRLLKKRLSSSAIRLDCEEFQEKN